MRYYQQVFGSLPTRLHRLQKIFVKAVSLSYIKFRYIAEALGIGIKGRAKQGYRIIDIFPPNIDR